MQVKVLSISWQIAVFLVFAVFSRVVADQVASNPDVNVKTRTTLNWLSNLHKRADNKVVVGQYITRHLNNTDGRTPALAWEYYYQELHGLTGHYPGLAGFDFSSRAQLQQSGSDNAPSDSNWRQYAFAHARQGGLLRLMWHSGNPWTDASSWSAIPSGHSLKEIITPGNPSHDTWVAWLSALADHLQYYKDRNITVLWGPLHEANGDWFWWGGVGTDCGTYIEVWKHMYQYLTVARGLDNLLWEYCPANHVNQRKAIEQYPGNTYVDIISPDKYDNADITLYNEFTSDRYKKVFGWGEVGQNEKSIDNRMFIHQIRNKFPKVSFYLQWADNRTTKSIRSNEFSAEVMADDWILTRDEVGKDLDRRLSDRPGSASSVGSPSATPN